MGSIDMSLKGKIILITGGASGIGLSLTKQCHALGARVLVADLKTTPAYDSFASSLSNITFVQADVSQWSSFERMFAVCEEKWNDVPDFYGICAGLFEPPFSNFWDDTEEDGYKQVEVNVSHPIKLTRMAIRKSVARGKRASVCIIASIAGIAGNIAAPLYCATKHAIVGFVKSLKDTEPLTGLKVTTICPGLVNTPMFTPSKVAQFSFSENKALSPDSVASYMLDMLQKKEWECGSVLEISMAGPRRIPEWNIEPPVSKGTGQEMAENMDMFATLLKPIEAKLNAEKRQGPKL
ncbi:NAD(P)-binding protein [Pleomassaria siparia CBS 279.74]|uniref:NAD(P)-binding protein n=1 Tax=Pleomassaria siparia CBS 279.74 TaxID=1314801 RepID=A0A6G1JT94_9PLEO|nr:NAD(P)-binding protein [Pleomassaria siparia CBS 279.74]